MRKIGKKEIAVLVALLLIPAGLYARNQKIYVPDVFTAEVVVASATATSDPIDLKAAYNPHGYFSLQLTVAGSGTAKMTYTLSNDGVTYVTPSSAAGVAVADIVTAATAGNSLHAFSPPLAKYMKIVITETSTTDSVTVTAVLGVQ